MEKSTAVVVNNSADARNEERLTATKQREVNMRKQAKNLKL
jgi:hypothetical protein